MKKISMPWTPVVLITLLVGTLTLSAQSSPDTFAQMQSHTSSLSGATSTLLADERVLIVGGEGSDGKPVSTVSIVDHGKSRPIAAKLAFARHWHTATVLANGDVLILGGMGADGHVVLKGEIFHPDTATLSLLTIPAPKPRAFHTATLLTDGRVFIAGGVSTSGRILDTVEAWDPRQKTADIFFMGLHRPRWNHTASLLPNGNVLISGGKNEQNNPIAKAEIFDADTQSIEDSDNLASTISSESASFAVAASIPDDNAPVVPLDTLIAIRFLGPAQLGSVNASTISVTGPSGTVDSRVIAAEGGMLAFINPNALLMPDSIYHVRLSNVTDANTHSPISDWEFTFTTIGQSSDGETWIPDSSWRTGLGASTWQSLLPLQAPAGVTALAGQVLKLNGEPLSNVTLQIDDKIARSDNTGRFLLSNIAAGHHPMLINGHTADHGFRVYGVYEAGVDLQAGQTTALKYTIWMSPLDLTHAVRIPSPTPAETVITNPLIPGLEFRIPAGTVIKDNKGNIVHEVSITPIPLDRPPFPLPHGVVVPIYFTLQPGAGYVEVHNSNGAKGGRLIYPNSFRQRPGTKLNFWDYDADAKGWFIYGQGRVTADGKQVAPDPGVEIYELTGAMVASGGYAASGGPPHGNPKGKSGDPVDLSTGLFVYQHTDLVVNDVVPIVVSRTYRQNDFYPREFGMGTSIPYDMFLTGDACDFPIPGNCYTYADLSFEDGSKIHYVRTSPGYHWYDATFEASNTPDEYFGSKIYWNGTGWNLLKKDGSIIQFPDSSDAPNALKAGATAFYDRYGNKLNISRNFSTGQIDTITSPNGRWIRFTSDGTHITQVQDNIGRTVSYAYDVNGQLIQVTDANGGVTNYTYSDSGDMTSIQDPRGIDYLTNQYGLSGAVVKQIQADGSTYQFGYTLNPLNGGLFTETDVTDPRGNVRKVMFNANGYTQSDTFAYGKPEQQTTTYNWDLTKNLLQSMTDPMGRQMSYTYDAKGNMLTATVMNGTTAAATTTFTYDPTFNQVASVTDPLQHTTTFQLDAMGSVASITDALTHTTAFTYNSTGRPLTVTDALQNTTTFGYDSGDLVSITDPLGHTTTRTYDNAGRVIAVANPLNQIRRMQWDNLDQILQTTDPLQQITSFNYDPNGDLLSYTDANLHAVSYTYDNMDRMLSRTDALGRSDSYQYDALGNVTSYTDRRGKITTFNYDGLNRKTFAGFGTSAGPSYESQVNYTYDNANRIINLTTESSARNVSRTYNDVNRTLAETTSLGTVSYVFDAAGRRSNFTVTGQPSISYSYDAANRLTQIAQGTATVLFGYDNANHRNALTMPNGVTVQYGYDNAANLTALTYQFGATVLGNLTYAFDLAGRRTQLGGTFARVALPQPVSVATYDASNALMQWGTNLTSLDPSGNMLADGATTYTWNAHNQLAAINGVGVLYDGLDRRIQTSAGTQFLYDGLTAVQELTSNTPVANRIVSNNSPDEFFLRTDVAGALSPLTDATGSTIALSNALGSIQTQYTYEPFGKTSSSGTASGNSFQFSGRENDGSTGLYYLRSRYYDSSRGRFLSIDHKELAGGDPNAYAYSKNDPINYVDPFGFDRAPLSAYDRQLLQEECLRTANRNFSQNLNDIAEATAPEPMKVLGLDDPKTDVIVPAAEIWEALLKKEPPNPYGMVFLHLVPGIVGEGLVKAGAYVYYAGGASNDYSARAAACTNY